LRECGPSCLERRYVRRDGGGALGLPPRAGLVVTGSSMELNKQVDRKSQ
jgi:hypothetical protein